MFFGISPSWLVDTLPTYCPNALSQLTKENIANKVMRKSVDVAMKTLKTNVSLILCRVIHNTTVSILSFPRRYNSLISLRKSVALISMSWFVSLSISVTCLASLPPLAFRPEFGACLPVFRHNAVFPVAYYSLGFLLPICIVIAFNLKIVSIAKYHQYR